MCWSRGQMTWLRPPGRMLALRRVARVRAGDVASVLCTDAWQATQAGVILQPTTGRSHRFRTTSVPEEKAPPSWVGGPWENRGPCDG